MEGPRRVQKAGFSIFFDLVEGGDEPHWETRLYHAESGVELAVPGTTPQVWIQWVLERLSAAVEAAPRPEDAATRARGIVDVAGVEVLDVSVVDAPDSANAVHTVTAQVIVQLTGFARVEREIGSSVLRGIASAPARRHQPPPT